MKNGRTIQQFAEEIQRQQDAKRDFLIPANKINPFVNGKQVEVGFSIKDNAKELFTASLTDNGHQQLGQFCGIPKKYYDLLLPHPELLATNLKHWLERSNEKRMVRSLDGKVRALLSEKYRRLDNYDLAQNVLPMLNDVNAKIESCEITDKKLYIKAITHQVQSEIKKGDIVSAGLIISNSEVGHGSLSVKPLVYRLVCSNGMICDDYAMRKYHIGRVSEMEQIEFSNETLKAEDKAFWLKVKDLVKFTLDSVTFEKIADSMREAADRKIAEPEKAIEIITKDYGFGEAEKKNILSHLIQGGDLTSWGLANAVTRMAQDVPSYDRSVELETMGFEIMQGSWN
jgi:hypothetical protein